MTVRYVTLVVSFLLAVVALADDWAPPAPRVFASSRGLYALKVVPPSPWTGSAGPTAQGTLFTLGPNGEEHVVWTKPLVNVPATVYVTDGGRVVTFDTYARLGYEHAATVYDDRGTPVADRSLSELLTADEIAKLPTTSGSRWWLNEARVRFSSNSADEWRFVGMGSVRVRKPGQEQMTLTLDSGRTLTFDLASGKVK